MVTTASQIEELFKHLRYDFANAILYNKLSTKLQNTNVLQSNLYKTDTP